MKINELNDAREEVKLLRAITSLRGQSDFETLLDYLRFQQKRVDKKLRRDRDRLEALQGQAQILEEFTEMVETSTEVLAELLHNIRKETPA